MSLQILRLAAIIEGGQDLIQELDETDDRGATTRSPRSTASTSVRMSGGGTTGGCWGPGRQAPPALRSGSPTLGIPSSANTWRTASTPCGPLAFPAPRCARSSSVQEKVRTTGPLCSAAWRASSLPSHRSGSEWRCGFTTSIAGGSCSATLAHGRWRCGPTSGCISSRGRGMMRRGPPWPHAPRSRTPFSSPRPPPLGRSLRGPRRMRSLFLALGSVACSVR